MANNIQLSFFVCVCGEQSDFLVTIWAKLLKVRHFLLVCGAAFSVGCELCSAADAWQSKTTTETFQCWGCRVVLPKQKLRLEVQTAATAASMQVSVAAALSCIFCLVFFCG